MADLEKTVAVLFKGVDEISGTMNSISGSLGTFGGKLESATQPLADMALMVEKVGAGLTALAVGGLVYAFNKYSDLSSAVAELDKVLGDNAEGLANAKQNAFELSEQYGTSMVDIVGSTADFIQAGFTVEESMTLVKNSMDLAIAGNIQAGDASEYLVKTLKGFKAPAEDAARVVDVLNEVSNVYATDVKQLAEGMSRIAPIASIMGLSFEETAALLTPIIEVFGSGAEAADALKIGLLKLSDDAKPITAALENLGVAQKNYNGELRPTKDILADVQARFTSLTAEQKLFFTSQLVGLEQAPRMIEVFNGGALSAKILEDALRAGGSAAEEVAKQLATPEKQLAILQQSFVNLAEAIGEKYGKSATEVISASNSIIVALQNALGEGAFNSILNDIDSFLSEFATYLKDVAKVAPEALKNIDFSEFLKSLKELGGSVGDLFEGLFGNFDLTTADGLAAALQKIVDGITKLSQFSTGIAEGLQPFLDQMGIWINKTLEADANTVKLAGQADGFGQGINALVKALSFLGPAMAIFSGAIVVDAISTLGKVAAAMTPIGIAAAAVTSAVLLMAAGAAKMSSDFEKGTAGFDELGNVIDIFPDKADPVVKIIGALSNEMNDIPEIKSFSIDAETGEATEKIDTISKSILSFPEDFSIDVGVKVDAGSIGAASALMNDMPRTFTADYYAVVDQPSIDKTKAVISEIINPDGTKTWVNVGVDETSLKKTQDALKEIPTEKMLEIKLQGNIDKELALIKAGAETVQKSMEWTAKVEIATVEADAKRLEAAFGSVASSFDSISSEIASLFSKDWGSMDFSEYYAIRDAAAQALKLQKEIHAANMELVNIQIEYEAAKVTRMKYGDIKIKIESSALEPSLEMIMWQILQKVQLKANEEHASFLLGALT